MDNQVNRSFTYETLIFNFIEKYTTAWCSLPQEVRRLMVKCPELFTLTMTTNLELQYNDVTIKYNENARVWAILKINPAK